MPLAPTPEEYNRVQQQLHRMDRSEEAAAAHRNRLAVDHGVYAAQRLDAYMLGGGGGDGGVFPAWVAELPAPQRDATKFGGLGLAERDEVLRAPLAAMPTDARRAEWERPRGARAYADGTERPLTPTEMRSVRLGCHESRCLALRRLRRTWPLRAAPPANGELSRGLERKR